MEQSGVGLSPFAAGATGAWDPALRMSVQGEGACLPTGSGSCRVPHDVGGLSVLLVWLGEAKPHPGAALKNPPVIGELVDDPQTPAAVSAGHRAWCDCDIALV